MLEANNFMNNLNYLKQKMESLIACVQSSYNNPSMDWSNLDTYGTITLANTY